MEPPTSHKLRLVLAQQRIGQILPPVIAARLDVDQPTRQPAKSGGLRARFASSYSRRLTALNPARERHVGGAIARSRLTNPSGRRVGLRSERQVEPKRFVEFRTQWAVERAEQCSDALDIDRSNLFGLSFRVAWQPG